MQIKEVEEKTGLTAKSIRYYESKNLIQVERNAGNSYRDYSKEDVNRLKCIKLFRYLDFSIELEEFDQALMELGIPKDADVEGYQNCDFDQVYVERFLRIINR